ncbi:MAG: hypothetical protein E6686_10175 [Lachnospiraceae bacterium]|nr:hypothetical protein [Lachnospiraceae bacterium]
MVKILKKIKKTLRGRSLFQIDESVLLNENCIKEGCQDELKTLIRNKFPVIVQSVKKSAAGEYIYCIKSPNNKFYGGFLEENLRKLPI